MWILVVERNNTVQPHCRFVVKCMSHVGRDAIVQSIQSLRVMGGMSRSTRLCSFFFPDEEIVRGERQLTRAATLALSALASFDEDLQSF